MRNQNISKKVLFILIFIAFTFCESPTITDTSITDTSITDTSITDTSITDTSIIDTSIIDTSIIGDLKPKMVLINVLNGTQSDSLVLNSNFYMDVVEVTLNRFKSMMNSTYGIKNFEYSKYLDNCPDESNYPVHHVSKYEAILYCNARSKSEGLDTVYMYDYLVENSSQNLTADLNIKGYRLPTISEWEFACRGASKTEFYWGNEINDSIVKKYEWFNKNATWKYWTEPHAEEEGSQRVAQKLPNPYGLFDMLGNLSEWCTDYRIKRSIPDPYNAILKGGNWNNKILGIEHDILSWHFSRDSRYGFRCVINE